MAKMYGLNFNVSLGVLMCVAFGLSTSLQAQEKFLDSDQAFVFEARSVGQDQAQLNWQIAPDYYLYKQQFSVTSNKNAVAFSLPVAKDKHDDYFGDTQVYYQQLNFKIQTQPNQTYQVSYQGCAEKGLCYPLSQSEFATDADGLVILNNPTETTVSTGLFGTKATAGFNNTTGFNNSTTSIQNNDLNTYKSITDTQVQPQKQASTTAIAADQQWSDRLHQQSFFLSILLFLGLGCLLAFTPCSLPMLPILSSLLLRKHEGVKAIFISLTFVVCMASVYAVLGVLAASAGNNLQRWLQQPLVLMGFSLIFIVFALNLFGVFELKLPQKWANGLDRLQAKQQGGTLIGAGVMGVLSALLVGPCMTAPLAGTLLYISQTQNLIIGASLLFSLGIGMGIPMLLLTLIGQHAVPKPGRWMNYVRHIFAFLMLGLSVYFIRPLLSMQMFNLALLAVVIAWVGYLLWLIKRERHWVRYSALVVLMIVGSLSVWQSVNYWSYQQQQTQVWQVVTTEAELNQALAQAKINQQNAVIDLYADWCIACQPLEREVWSNPEVQQALTHVAKIKLDLTVYDPAHQKLLKQWQLLGPPTALFIHQDGQEQRDLRLTGSFNRGQLLQNLKQ